MGGDHRGVVLDRQAASFAHLAGGFQEIRLDVIQGGSRRLGSMRLEGEVELAQVRVSPLLGPGRRHRHRLELAEGCFTDGPKGSGG